MIRWLVAGGVALAFVLLPFVAFGDAIETWTTVRLDGAAPGAMAALVVALLAGDIVLPVPSSFVSTGAGVGLGAFLGSLTSWVGMTVGCVFGYLLGRRVGRPGLTRWVRVEDLTRFDELLGRFGPGAVVLCRAVPVVAEVSVLAAGASRMSMGAFLTGAAAANAGISMVYAAAGARAATWGSFLVALGAAVVLPALSYLVLGVFTTRGAGEEGLN